MKCSKSAAARSGYFNQSTPWPIKTIFYLCIVFLKKTLKNWIVAVVAVQSVNPLTKQNHFSSLKNRIVAVDVIQSVKPLTYKNYFKKKESFCAFNNQSSLFGLFGFVLMIRIVLGLLSYNMGRLCCFVWFDGRVRVWLLPPIIISKHGQHTVNVNFKAWPA